MVTLNVTVYYDRAKLSETQLTDSLNDYFHGLASELGGSRYHEHGFGKPDDTGGYDVLDWEYETA